MYQNYINLLNHNRYLKIQYLNSYKYSKLLNINIFIKIKTTDINNKFFILCMFFLFKTLLFKNGFIIILNKKNKKILGFKFILKKQLMFNFLNILISIFLNQPEIQNIIKINSFDLSNNYNLSIAKNYNYYLEKYIVNNYFKKILHCFDINCIFHFTRTNDIFNNIFYLNLFKFYFINLK